MPTKGSRVLSWLERLPRASQVAATLVLIAGAGLGDWLSGAEVAFTLAYLLPIGIASWCLGRRLAIATAIVCSLIWIVDDLATRQFALPPAISMVNLGGELLIFLLFALLLSTLRARLLREHQLARTDPLTGLCNRRAFWDEARLELERSRRFHLPLSLVYLDVDDFKRVNDRLGHQRGDELLAGIAATLREGIRGLDTVARLGGDEFALLLAGTDQNGAVAAVERLRQRLQAAPWQAQFRATSSIGCITALVPLRDVDELVACADALMYAAKRAGKGSVRYEVFRGEMAAADQKSTA